jgi:RNA polymerase sigma-70 factor (ECF subfamily)
MLGGRERRARPMDLGPATEPIIENLATPEVPWIEPIPDPSDAVVSNLNALPEVTWIEPAPEGLIVPDGDPAEVTAARETVKLAFVAALQHLPPRQRAVLILCEVLRWKASEAAELLDTSVASVNSALQRARATLASTEVAPTDSLQPMNAEQQEFLARYVDAFERYDLDALTSLIHEDATQSMPPYDMWLRGRDDIFTWWYGPGIGCKGSRVIPAGTANGSPAFGQYKPSETGSGFDPWALQVVEVEAGAIVELTFFLDTERVFPLFGLPARLDA